MTRWSRHAGYDASFAALLLGTLAATCASGPPAAPIVPAVHAPPAAPPPAPPADEVRVIDPCVGDSIEGTLEAREVASLCDRYRRGLEDKDWAALVALASPRYHDDAGTPEPADDVTRDELAATLERFYGHVGDVGLEIRVDRITAGVDVVCVDFAYTSTYTLDGRTVRHDGESRLVLERSEDGLRILSGM